MGVMLRPGEDPLPSEEELARLAGLVPGDADRVLSLDQGLAERGRALVDHAFAGSDPWCAGAHVSVRAPQRSIVPIRRILRCNCITP